MYRYIPEPMEPVTIFARDNGAFVPYYILNEKTRKPLSIKELCDTTGCFPLLLTTYQKDSFTVRPNMSNTCGALAMYVQARPKLKNKPITEIHRAAFNDAYLLYNVNEFDILKKQDSRPWDSLMAERKNIAVYYESPAYLARKRAVDSIRAAYAERERIQDSILALKIEKNPAYRLNKLGWVNCDRLGYLGENQVATIKINLDKKDNYDLKVIVKKEKQVLTPSRTENGVAEFRVKKDENIVLVAMKIENGESFLSIMNVRGENTTLTPNLKALSVAEIKEKLKVLDN